MAITCPRCGLKNPSEAQRCDCGQQFSAEPTEPRQCANCGRSLGALERGLQRDGHVVCAECAPRLDAEHRSARRTKPWPKLVAALAVAVIGAGAVLARHLAHNGGDDCQQAAHKIASRVSAEMGSSNEFDEAGYATKCRDRTNPRHLTAAHYRKEVDCVLKADSDDALIECMKMSEVREASLILNTIGHAVAGIVQRSHNIPVGNAFSTSTRDLCAIAHREVRPDWSAGLWRAMHIDFMERPEQFDNPQYAVTYEGDANGFHVEAVGDTDCNGRAATWKLDGKLVNGEVETTGVDLLPAEARLVHQDRAAANTSTPGLGSESSGAAPTLAPIPPQTPSNAAVNANSPNDHGTDPHGQVEASSTHASAAGYSFSAANLFDADLTTCWQADRGDKSPWVQVEFDAPLTITAIEIANGFQITDKFGDEFVLNSRIADGRIRFSDNTEVTIHFEPDERGFIAFTIPAKSARSLRLIVDKTYRGTRWNDLAVSEINIVSDAHASDRATTSATVGREAQQLLSTGSGHAAYASTDHGTTITRLVYCTASQCMVGFTDEQGHLGPAFPGRISSRTLRVGGPLKLNAGHGDHSELWTFSDDATAATISETTDISVDPLPPSHFASKHAAGALIDCDADKVCAALRASLASTVAQ